MGDRIVGVTAEDCAVIEEERALLVRARAAIAREEERRARQREEARRAEHTRELRSIEALRELRDEASRASADDLPALLHELGVRQQLARQTSAGALPDPAAPYFAHLRVREGAVTKDYLLGRATCLDARLDVRIVDWRVAPVSRIFYRYTEGEEFEESFPGRDVEGTVLARRIVVIDGGELVRILVGDVALVRVGDGDRERWERSGRGALSLSAGGAGTAVRPASRAASDVTALLDREQFAAVSAPPEQPLVVLGSAGSGKTTVALHRLAHVTARNPRSYPLARTEVVVPEEGLARLSRRLLAPLGAAESQVHTLDAWALARARAAFGEPFPRVWYEAPGLVASTKRHPALFDALCKRFAKAKPSSTSLRALRRRLADVLTDRAFLTSVVAASSGELPVTAVEETVRHTMLQLAEPVKKQLRSITDASKKRAVDGRALDDGTPDELAGTIDVEDLPILLFLRAFHGGALPGPSIAHLVVDEAEDFALFELFVLGRLLGDGRSVTLAGDEAQQTSPCFAGWSRAVETLGADHAVTCRLEISYRCPAPVVAVAQEILGPLATSPGRARAARDGAPVGVHAFPADAHAELFLATTLRDLVDREPQACIGVLARDAAAAVRVFGSLADVPRVRLVTRGAFTFEPGIEVAEVDAAKGLEFDYVVVPDATAAAYPATDDARRLLHVAATRASHQLWLVSGGEPTALVGAFAAGARAAHHRALDAGAGSLASSGR